MECTVPYGLLSTLSWNTVGRVDDRTAKAANALSHLGPMCCDDSLLQGLLESSELYEGHR